MIEARSMSAGQTIAAGQTPVGRIPAVHEHHLAQRFRHLFGQQLESATSSSRVRVTSTVLLPSR